MGQGDSPLTDLGQRQASAIADRLSRIPFSALYSSDLGRAFQTATRIGERSGKAINLDADLREMSLGIFEGYVWEELKDVFPSEWADYHPKENRDYVIPNGESRQQKFERSVGVINRIADAHPDETVVVVSHAGVLLDFFEFVLGLAAGNERRFMRKNATYNSFLKTEGTWALEVWGDDSHLAGRFSPLLSAKRHDNREVIRDRIQDSLSWNGNRGTPLD